LGVLFLWVAVAARRYLLAGKDVPVGEQLQYR
jgi:hypothetical protein